MKKLFESMDEGSKRFYSRVFNTALLNIYAVQRGYFQYLICETEDPMIMVRWHEAVPGIVQRMQLNGERTDEET